MLTTKAGILFGLIGFNFILIAFLTMAYPVPTGTPNPMNDLASLGTNVGGTGLPGTSTTYYNQNQTELKQAQAVSTVCGLSGIGGAVGGAIVGGLIGNIPGAIVGAVVGYFGVGSIGCTLAAQNPGAAANLVSSIQSLPIISTITDLAYALRYVNVLLKFLPDTLAFISAVTQEEPAVGGFLIVLTTITAIWFSYTIVTLVRGTSE